MVRIACRVPANRDMDVAALAPEMLVSQLDRLLASLPELPDPDAWRLRPPTPWMAPCNAPATPGTATNSSSHHDNTPDGKLGPGQLEFGSVIPDWVARYLACDAKALNATYAAGTLIGLQPTDRQPTASCAATWRGATRAAPTRCAASAAGSTPITWCSGRLGRCALRVQQRRRDRPGATRHHATQQSGIGHLLSATDSGPSALS